MSTATSPTFNPFTFANRLKEAGVPEKQAAAEAELLHDVLMQQTQVVSALEGQVRTLAADAKREAEQVATKADVREAVARTDRKVEAGFAEVRSDVKLLKWMLGLLIAAAAPLIVRAYLGG